RVRITVPLAVKDAVVRQVVADKLDWIRRKQAEFQSRPRPVPLRLRDGEGHYFLGRPYRLRVVEQQGAGRVRLGADATLELRVPVGAALEQRIALLENWYRRQLRELLPELVAKWEQVVGMQAAEWRIRKMSTRWGSCNIGARRIWLNLELAKKPLPCLEYVIVHELVHLLEPRHNARFRALMDRFLPSWRSRREQLNCAVSGRPLPPP
ncbi:MAG: SprT family zinc-dependent metalloprotease, partial [Desulfuromonadaceae bacterium]